MFELKREYKCEGKSARKRKTERKPQSELMINVQMICDFDEIFPAAHRFVIHSFGKRKNEMCVSEKKDFKR